MRTHKAFTVLAVAVLLFAGGLPALAEEASPEAALLCSSDLVASLPGSVGNAQEAQPAQSCGPCLLEFCAEPGVRCDYTGCGPNNQCCTYFCSCDSTCTSGGVPSYACRLVIPCCSICSNNVKQCSEVCDGTDLGGMTCELLGFDGGTLACQSGCAAFDTSGCFKCGDGNCDESEDCDSCSSDCEGQDSGKPSVRFCCGNGVTEPAEGDCSICDGNC